MSSTSDRSPLRIGTHSGSFHADDVLAIALVRAFADPAATVTRTRDLEVLAACDLVADVGGEFEPARRRFDHHQQSYEGPLSSAGMVLDWLEAEQHLDGALAGRLRAELVDYVDAVDNGRRSPDHDVPCFTSIVGAFTNDPGDGSEHDDRFEEAARFAQRYLQGIAAGHRNALAARDAVRRAMELAVERGKRTLVFEDYVPWKSAYYEFGGAEHPTEFAVFPSEGTWRVYGIPPEPGSFAQKRPLPEAWAGLVDDELEAATGIRGAKFCHKNRFIAVFATRDGLMQALREAFGPDYAE